MTNRRLIILGLFVVALAAGVFFKGAEIRASRERAYPIPSTNCQKSQTCDERALQISARESVTADNALDVAVFQLVLSVFGIGGVTLTIYYAHLAWREAQESASVARDSMKMSRDANQQSLRPYLFAQSFEYIRIADKNDIITHWRLGVVWKNTGQTPAHKVRMAAFFISAKPSLGTNFDFPDYPGHDPYVGAMGPEQSFTTYADIPIAALIDAHAGIAKIHYWSWCDYNDGFPDTIRHRTEKHAILLPAGDPTKKECHFEERINPGFNGADNYCHRSPEPYST